VRLVHVSSEVAPWSQTGGLGQVAGALPDALAATDSDLEVAIITPLYQSVRAALDRRGEALTDSGVDVVHTIEWGSWRGRLLTLDRGDRPPVHFLDCPELYDRDGLYDGGFGPHGDNPLRFSFLARAAVDAAPRLLGGAPDVVHAHDWQTGLIPAQLRGPLADWLPQTRSVFTIHNLAYQGCYPAHQMAATGLPADQFQPTGLEYWGQLNMLKAGISYADAVTTVSPSYAAEIQTPAFGEGLDGHLRHHAGKLHGILNGIDTVSWNPATDPQLAARFSAGELDGKRACRAALVAETGLPAAGDELLVGVVSRFAGQKGIDLIAALIPAAAELGIRLAILGSGEAALEVQLRHLAAAHPDRLWVQTGFSTELARRIYAGADATMIPSRFEPCGLAQMYAMRYGTLPIVHAVGGLRDTVVHDQTGFCFEHPTVDGLRWATEQALARFRDPAAWRERVDRAMAVDWSWARSAGRYRDLYRSL
jgi:starch synthase